ncbi:hypothetical protein D3Z38_08995 [Clostridiales bacterium]|nr:hypothetical protein [Clostridiales bacterium]
MKEQKQNLTALLNTMKLIEVRGESAMHMANCLQHVSNMINELEESEKAEENEGSQKGKQHETQKL